MSDFWEKTEQYIYKASDWMQNQVKLTLARKTDDEIIKIYQSPNLSEIEQELIEEEMRRRRL